MHPQVSVVINSYNHAAFVGETIQSVLDQSFQDFEIVITDDGSTDSTPDVIRGFTDPRIHLQVFEQNRGMSTAMNDTIARARGEFIAILNSDDFALPGRLAAQVAFLRANPQIAAVFGLPRLIDERGRPTKGFFDFTLPFSLPDFSRRSWLNHFFFHCNCLCHPTAMIRRSVYGQVGGYDPRVTNLQDFDMWVRVCIGHDIHVMRDELTAYRVRDDNRNMSAPRHDTSLRSQFEFSRILKHYRAMGADFIRHIFADELVANRISLDGSHELWLVELALTVPSPAHRLFALETLFEAAQRDQHMRRLHDLAGSVDLFGLISAGERDAKIEALNQATAERDAKIEALNQAMVERGKMIESFVQSRSWRYTAPLRWVRRQISEDELGRRELTIQPDLKQAPLAIIAAYNEPDIFPQILLRLLKDGIHVHVIDNWSSDGTYETIRQIASDWRGAISIERFPDSGPVRHFELTQILRRNEEISAQWPSRWIINQDSDELRCSPWHGVSFHEGLRRVSAQGFSAIDFACVHFRPVDDSFLAGMDPEMHFRFFERDPPNIAQVQAWCQPTTMVDLAETGGHETRFPGRNIYPEKFILKHYPIRNLEQGRRKVFAERLGRFHPDERARGMHIHYDHFRPNDILLWNPDDLLEWGRDPAISPGEPWIGPAPLRGRI